MNFQALLFMAILTFLPESTQTKRQTPTTTTTTTSTMPKSKKQKQPSSWNQIKNLLTCKQIEGARVHDPSKFPDGYSKKASSCNSICSFKDVVHGNTRVVHRADNSPEASTLGQETSLLSRKRVQNGLSTRSNGYSSSHSRGMQLRKLSGCYECHTIVDPSRFPTARTVCACSQCGEVFPEIESLELHQAIRHAVSELGPDDSGRNIVEIIFKSSWLKNDNATCKIERILKVHNTSRKIQRFEDCRDAVKSHALTSSRKNPRCAADGNELLRFQCTTLMCSLRVRGSTNICGLAPRCGVCTTIRFGFQNKECKGVRTMASSGLAHDSLLACVDGVRAMIVCRVIAGRVKRVVADGKPLSAEETGSYDSVAGYGGVYTNMEELFVLNPRAILPCFVVIYK